MSILLPATPTRHADMFPLYVFSSPSSCLIIEPPGSAPRIAELSEDEKRELDKKNLRLVSLLEWRKDWEQAQAGGEQKVCTLPFGYESGDTIAVWYEDLLPLIPKETLARCIDKATTIVQGEISSQREHEEIMSGILETQMAMIESRGNNDKNSNISDNSRNDGNAEDSTGNATYADVLTALPNAEIMSEAMHILYDDEPDALLPVYYLLSKKNLRDLPETAREARKR